MVIVFFGFLFICFNSNLDIGFDHNVFVSHKLLGERCTERAQFLVHRANYKLRNSISCRKCSIKERSNKIIAVKSL